MFKYGHIYGSSKYSIYDYEELDHGFGQIHNNDPVLYHIYNDYLWDIPGRGEL